MSVLIHSCPEIHKLPPESCDCRQTMRWTDVSRLVQAGMLEWVRKFSHKRKQYVPDYRHAYFCEVASKTPRTATIEQEHIERAYLGAALKKAPSSVRKDKFEPSDAEIRKVEKQIAHAAHLRIEEFGRLARESYAALTKLYDHDTLYSAKYYLRINGKWCFGRDTATVDNGDLVKPLKPLEKKNDQSKLTVGSTEKSSSGSPQVPGGVSASLVRRQKRRVRKNDQVSGVRSTASSS